MTTNGIISIFGSNTSNLFDRQFGLFEQFDFNISSNTVGRRSHAKRCSHYFIVIFPPYG